MTDVSATPVSSNVASLFLLLFKKLSHFEEMVEEKIENILYFLEKDPPSNNAYNSSGIIVSL